MALIYEPAGRAREYSELALNIYTGCDHACDYCYAPSALQMKREEFIHPKLRPREFIKQLGREAEGLRKRHVKTPILLCFTCDPYQVFNEKEKLARKALEILLGNDLNVTILTKGGRRSERDFDLLQDNKHLVKYGITVVFVDDRDTMIHEPGAAPTWERVATLRKAHDLGLKTWISLEPVYNPKDALELIDRTHEFCDEYKIGKINYDKAAEAAVDWKQFAVDVSKKIVSYKRDFLLKNDLRKYME